MSVERIRSRLPLRETAREMERDERRSARLLFGPELATGALEERELLASAEVRQAVAAQRIPSALGRAAQRAAMRRGRLTFEQASIEPMIVARRALLGERAAGPPRLLIRVDEFPHVNVIARPELGLDSFRHFHACMAGAPYLLAVMPAVAAEPFEPRRAAARALDRRRPGARRESQPEAAPSVGQPPEERALDDHEVALLTELRTEGVSFGQHGYNHRTRHRHPRRHSELSGLRAPGVEELLDRGAQRLAEVGVRPRVFVPPYNRFDPAQYPLLAERFDVICGGPESVLAMGFHAAPLWRGEAVYLPVYEPLYGRAVEILPIVERLIERQAGIWVPIVLHWGWEALEEWDALERLMQRAAPYATSWEAFLDAVAASR